MNNWDIENNKYVRHRYKIIYQTTLPGCRLELEAEAAREIRGFTSPLLLPFLNEAALHVQCRFVRSIKTLCFQRYTVIF